MERKPIVASEGMMLTDGVVYGKEIWLAEGMSSDEFYEITDEEYANIQAAEAKKAEVFI